MTALSPGRSGPLPGDALLTRGLWQYARYYGPVTSAPKATTPAASPGQDQASQPLAHRCSGLVTSGNQNSLRACQEPPEWTGCYGAATQVAGMQIRLIYCGDTGRGPRHGG